MKKFILFTILISGLMAQGSILKQFSDQFADIAEKANPAIVTIVTEKKVKAGRFHQGPQDNDFFRFFNPQTPQREFKTQALGSGIIVDARKGFILTNNHVIEDADKITVRLLDKREYYGEVVGRDPKSDIAILKIEAHELVELNFGNSDKLRVGEWVIAVGSPFSANLSHTVTAGIVSAKGRGNVMGNPEFYEDFIQTDAAINPGNSGGALLNIEGDLIGINTAIYTGGFDRSNKGIGFAIPSNMAKKIMDDLIKHGRVVRSWIGVQIQPINDAYAKALDLETRDGALIADVVKNSPAEKAGLKTGDVIMAFNGHRINGVDHLRNTVSSSRPDRRYDLKIIRDGKEKILKIRLEEMPGKDVELAATPTREEETGLGVKVQDISRSLLREYDIDGDVEGVIVTAVAPNSPAAREGIRPGDVITRVGTKTVRNARDFKSKLKIAEKNNVVLLHLKREGVSRYLTLELKD